MKCSRTTSRSLPVFVGGALFRSALTLAPLLCVPLAGCGRDIHGNGERETQEYELGDFDEVVARNSFDVEIEIDEELDGVSAVTVEADSNLHKYIDLSVDGSVLYIETEDGVDLFSDEGQQVKLALPRLDRASAHDAVSMGVFGRSESPKLGGDTFEAVARDAADISLDGWGEQVTLKASNSASIDATGFFPTGELRASDAASLNARELRLKSAQVRARDAADVDVCASEALSGKASDAAGVRFFCDPQRLEVDSSDAASVERG